MTKQLTRQEVEAVVERLSTEGTWYICNDCSRSLAKDGCDKCVRTTGPLKIGNVLEKMEDRDEFYPCYRYEVQGELVELVQLWQPLGLSRSLQEICETSGYEEKYQKIADMDVSYGVLFSDKDGFGECRVCGANIYHASDCSLKIERKKEVGILTSPEANALFSFLQEIV